MFKVEKIGLLILIFFFACIYFYAQEKSTEEIKVIEAEKKAKEDKEKAELLFKEQEKKAIENSKNFFKFISAKKNIELRKIISIPFVFDDSIIYTKKGVEEMIEEMVEGHLPEPQTLQFSIDRQPSEYTDNNIVVLLKDNNAESSGSFCMWLDRDSQKIIGFFMKELEDEQPNDNEEDKNKSSEDLAKKKAESIRNKRISEEEALRKLKEKESEESKK